MHMLYHVPDIPRAVNELRRVLRAGGVLLISTNGRGDKQEVDDLCADAVADLTGRRGTRPPGVEAFTLDDAAAVRDRFDEVVVRRYVRQTVVPDREPVLAFIDSLRSFDEVHLPAGLSWDDLLGAVARRVDDTISRTGAWAMTNVVGTMTCR